MIDASLLDEKSHKVINAYRALKQADPNFEALTWFGMRITNGEAVMSLAHTFNYAQMCAIPSHPIPIQPIMMSIVFMHYEEFTKIM